MLKKLLIGLGALLILGTLILAVILAPAHLQIREVEPELPTKADLESLKGNPNGPVKISYFITSTQVFDNRLSGHSTFVIEWEDGKILLVDLGMDRAKAKEFGELFETIRGADPAIPLGTAAEFLGADVSRVEGVGFTHLHSDHVQGINALCVAGKKEFTELHTTDQMTKHNLHTEDPFAMLSNSMCVNQQELAGDALSTDLFPGIGIYPLGGHTPGSTMFAIPVGEKLWLLTGDITNSRSNLVENRGKGFIYSYLMVPEYETRLAKLRPWLAGLDKDPGISAIVSHDPNALAESGMEQWTNAGVIE